MKTPKEYVKYLTQGICNEQMLADVIYSYNKRAKITGIRNVIIETITKPIISMINTIMNGERK